MPKFSDLHNERKKKSPKCITLLGKPLEFNRVYCVILRGHIIIH